MSYVISVFSMMGWIWTGVFFAVVALVWMRRRRRGTDESGAAATDA